MALNTPDVSVGFVSTYPPTVCGLATFTASLRAAIASTRGSSRGLGVLRQVDDVRDGWGRDSVHVQRRGDPRSLRAGVRHLNTFDAVSLQHEFGIFGGPDGREVLDLVDRLDVPVATTFHTMLADPTATQRRIVERLTARSERVVVMSETASHRLVRYYDVDPGRVTVIPHGADARFTGPSLTTGERPLILTWGLIGPGKGLEVAIEACLAIADLVPRPRYLIAGATHPNVLRNDGESYRDGLVALVERLGLQDVVEFDDRYLEMDDLALMVRSADLVVLPYASVDQVTSGVLVEAITASKPVIATTFPHSVEVLSSGAGILVPHGEAQAMGAALRHALADPDAVRRMGRTAGVIAKGWDWATIGRRYDELLTDVVNERPAHPVPVGTAGLQHAAG
jgi:glycosyltransferase involved in cell wall biosynthesis